MARPRMCLNAGELGSGPRNLFPSAFGAREW